jgi:MoaA/NifB/PqqE/SkfB family radical SAM enzyme
MDEHPLSSGCDIGPAVVSIALTNLCDLSCPFCYAPKSHHSLEGADVVRWSKEFSLAGTFEIAFGGGEPTLYSQLTTVCERVWDETDLGISLTTNGQHLDPELIERLVGHISILRISVDGPEPYYSRIRGRAFKAVLEAMSTINGRIPIGINTVMNRDTICLLDEMAELLIGIGVRDWLLLPQVEDGNFVMTANEWNLLNDWMTRHHSEFNLSTSMDAREHLSVATLFAEQQYDYAHIRADGSICQSSYKGEGTSIGNGSALAAYQRTCESTIRSSQLSSSPSGQLSAL